MLFVTEGVSRFAFFRGGNVSGRTYCPFRLAFVFAPSHVVHCDTLQCSPALLGPTRRDVGLPPFSSYTWALAVFFPDASMPDPDGSGARSAPQKRKCPRQAMTPQRLPFKGFLWLQFRSSVTITRIDLSIRTWQLSSPRASIRFVLHVFSTLGCEGGFRAGAVRLTAFPSSFSVREAGSHFVTFGRCLGDADCSCFSSWLTEPAGVFARGWREV